MKNLILLAGDIGGTKTNLEIFLLDKSSGNTLKPQYNTFKTYFNAEYENIELIIHHYLECVKIKTKYAVLAVAGPVVGGNVKVTNLPWIINEERLQNALKMKRLILINDIEAIAYAVPYLNSCDKFTINEGVVLTGKNIAVIAPGTGLGESFLTWNGHRFHAHATEGSHADFAPTNSLEIKLLNYLLSMFEHVSYERVCSGIGIVNIYSFLRDTGEAFEPEWLAKRIAGVDDIGAVIIDAAISEKPCELCRLTLDIFISVLGAEAGNLGLKVMAKGGVFIGGGIPPRILAFLNNGQFMKSFKNKGRML